MGSREGLTIRCSRYHVASRDRCADGHRGLVEPIGRSTSAVMHRGVDPNYIRRARKTSLAYLVLEFTFTDFESRTLSSELCSELELSGIAHSVNFMHAPASVAVCIRVVVQRRLQHFCVATRASAITGCLSISRFGA